MDGRDTLALLPTGGGKSICFQVPALCMDGICIVVSPLIALMKDQVLNLKKRGIPAYAIDSGRGFKDIDRIFELCTQGHVKFLYLSPERLKTELAIERIKRMKVNLFAVDEAHCISQWGYDFRPSYLNIAEIREQHPNVPVLALTATATKEVVQDIQDKLAFKENRQVFQKSFARSNLAYVVLHEEDKRSKLLDILKKVPGSAVVYVLNRRETKDIAEFLHKNGISANYYHAGVEAERRSAIQEAWIDNKIRVIVATNAFGMGIDKPDVRVVVHLTLPDSLEAYFQEAGRAGRDGEKAYGILLYNRTDRERLEQNYESSFPPFKEIRQVYQALGSYFQLAIGGGLGQSYDFDVLEFSTKYNFHPLRVLNALRLLVQGEYIALSESVYFPSSLQFRVDNIALYDFMLRQPKTERLLKLILRTAQGAFNHNVNIKETALAYQLKMPPREVRELLLKMHREKIIFYNPQRDVPSLTFLIERLDANDLVFDKERYRFLKTRYEGRMDAALEYAERLKCRSQLLLAYFDEQDPPTCGQCDVCLGRHKKEPSADEIHVITKEIKALLLMTPLPLRKVVGYFPANKEQKVIFVLEHLFDNAFIQKNEAQLLVWMDEKK